MEGGYDLCRGTGLDCDVVRQVEATTQVKLTGAAAVEGHHRGAVECTGALLEVDCLQGSAANSVSVLARDDQESRLPAPLGSGRVAEGLQPPTVNLARLVAPICTTSVGTARCPQSVLGSASAREGDHQDHGSRPLCPG